MLLWVRFWCLSLSPAPGLSLKYLGFWRGILDWECGEPTFQWLVTLPVNFPVIGYLTLTSRYLASQHHSHWLLYRLCLFYSMYSLTMALFGLDIKWERRVEVPCSHEPHVDVSIVEMHVLSLRRWTSLHCNIDCPQFKRCTWYWGVVIMGVVKKIRSETVCPDRTSCLLHFPAPHSGIWQTSSTLVLQFCNL